MCRRLALAVLFCLTVALGQIKTIDDVQVFGACTAAGGVPRTPPDSSKLGKLDYVEFDRSACFGSCADYRVRLYRSGQVEWEGRQFVQTAGAAAGLADPAATSAIFVRAQSSEFWSACDSYAKLVTDNPTYTLTTSIGGETKSVVDYAQGGPEWLRELMQQVDEAAGSQKWVGPNWYPIQVKPRRAPFD